MSELLNLLKDSSFSLEVYKNKIKILDVEKRVEALEDTLSVLKGIDFRIIKNEGSVRVIISLRDKFDPNMKNNRALSEAELFPFLSIMPQEYYLYAENYQAEINV